MRLPEQIAAQVRLLAGPGLDRGASRRGFRRPKGPGEATGAKRAPIPQACPACRPIKPAEARPKAEAASSSSTDSTAFKADPPAAAGGPHAQPATTRTHLTGRRLRSDSPKSEGGVDEQPLKRQNSMGTGATSGRRGVPARRRRQRPALGAVLARWHRAGLSARYAARKHAAAGAAKLLQPAW